ncbi:MAG: NAD(P)/FAD-dependent oxidoreductase, partial [Candidatus Micrarchaeota archaeon]|nr:NAD(P)/FAD-dependent oxidoreductase [Candidatus Micrarchaeota archaeon]
RLSEKGLSVSVITDKPHLGKDGKCTSIISATGLEQSGIPYQGAVVHDIFGANVHCRGACMPVRTKEPVARVLNRFALDQLSVGHAKDAGAQLFTNARFSHWDGQTAQTRAGPFAASLLVGADGVASSVAHACGFPALSDVAVAWEGEFESADLPDASVVDVFMDYPGLFAWTVPAGEKTVRIGLAVKSGQDLQAHKTRFLSEPPVARMRNGARMAREFYHAIPLHFRKKTQDANACLVGDAAGQVKATTGGGIVFGALCAAELAESARRFLDGGALDYEGAWRRKYAGALRGHRLIRGLLDRTPFGVATFGLSALSAIGFGRLLERKGDMDFITRPSG